MNYENYSGLTANNVNENNMDSYTQTLVENSHVSNNELTPWGSFQQTIGKLFTKVKKESPILFWVAMVITIMGIGCLIGLFIDERTLMGVSVWLKPLKFSISISLYLLTVGYLITKYPYSKRKKNLINHITTWSLLLEFLIILYQGSRGVQSHYNIATPLDGILFMLMGVFVGINVLTMVLFIVDTIRLKLKTTKPLQWAILLGWLIVLFGSWVGGQMIGQMGHNVAIPDGEAGLPLVNWSTKGGDLRVAHFFALHSIQIIPLFAVWLGHKWKFSQRKQLMLVILFTLMFSFMIGYIFYQAKQGIPFIAS
ncbi:hypothetical protein [Maribacter cobaltidurans]|uniref:Uncharacterized protein n=1 Tax=Maribacter cobaltidurans TaxID=1178778 RepID=A0A223V1S2_9FLAO|nr:hypothetical protein [Maribacter cobaltidurans]ASV29060.1 hypothetical protein CJ263_01810 [Maribacter cobaltidurans]GGD72233.1 hypothetical protein GCM10011412_07340 [Maribacter cobaltidurans]